MLLHHLTHNPSPCNMLILENKIVRTMRQNSIMSTPKCRPTKKHLGGRGTRHTVQKKSSSLVILKLQIAISYPLFTNVYNIFGLLASDPTKGFHGLVPKSNPSWHTSIYHGTYSKIVCNNTRRLSSLYIRVNPPLPKEALSRKLALVFHFRI